MKRWWMLGAIAIATVVASAVPAGATSSQPSQSTTVPVSGSITDGTARIVIITDPTCANGELFDLTGTGDIAPFGASSLVLHVCDRRRAGGLLESSFTLTGAAGTVSGTVATYGVTALPPPEVANFHFELTIASGTGRFTSPSGTIVLDGALHFPPAAPVTATVSGSVTFTEPASGQDCGHHDDRHGGDHRDDHSDHRSDGHGWSRWGHWRGRDD